MGVGGVIDCQIVTQTGVNIVDGIDLAAFEQPTGQDAPPHLHVMEPCPLLGRTGEDRLMGRIAPARAALHAAVQGLGEVRDVTPVGDKTADLEAPGGLEMIAHPLVARHGGQLLHDVGQLGGPIRTGAGLTAVPHEVARRDHA